MDTNPCKICGKESSSRCTNCRKVWYCSRPHQKDDWSAHKQDCFPGVVVSSPIFGRYLSATKDIAEGSLALKEKCLFSAPNGKNGTFVFCLGCYGVIKTEELASQLCSKCGWPLHKDCAKNKAHSENECDIFSTTGISPSSREQNIYDKILILRGCLLKQKDAKKWELVKQLQDHREDRLKTTEGAKLSKTMLDFVRIKCGLANFFTEDEVDHVVGCGVINAYVTEDNLISSPSFQAGSFVFWKGSMPAHDCTPNCKWTITRGGELRLWALRNIKEGQSLCHCYAWGGTGTLERQKHLLKSKFFLCSCTRCLDATEAGSFFSGIKCKDKNCLGFILSKDPAQLGSDWVCNSCGASFMTEIEVEELTKTLRAGYSTIVRDCTTPGEMGAWWRDILQSLEEFNDTILKTKVTPTHFVVQEVEQDILLRASYILAQVETELGAAPNRKERLNWAERLITLSRKCLALLDKVAPGITTHAGRQHYYLQQGLGILIMDRIEIESFQQSLSSSKIDLRQDITEWQEVRRRCLQILESESPGREEWVLGQAMKVDEGQSST